MAPRVADTKLAPINARSMREAEQAYVRGTGVRGWAAESRTALSETQANRLTGNVPGSRSRGRFLFRVCF